MRRPVGDIGFRALWRDDAAPTATEYAVLASGIAVLIVVAVAALGQVVFGLFDRVASSWP